jgi:tricorn protease
MDCYFSDASGEYELHLRDQRGTGDVKKIKLQPTFYYSPKWSPDSKKIAFTDKRLNLWYVDMKKASRSKWTLRVQTRARLIPIGRPDSKWIAYTKMIKSWTHTVFVYSLDESKISQVSDGMSDALSARFDKSGKYLYFTASTDIGPTYWRFGHVVLSAAFDAQRLCGRVQEDLPSPLAPESDEEKLAEDKKDEGKKDDAKPADKPADAEKKPETAQAAGRPADKKEPPKVTIDFDNISQRIIALPIPARNYAGLLTGKAGTLFIAEFPQGPPAPGAPFGLTIQKFDLDKRKLDQVVGGVQSFDVSANGEKLLYRQGPAWFIASAMLRSNQVMAG